jgi:hypothetical protein
VRAVIDPKRRVAESAIRTPSDTVVLVEGMSDKIFFQTHCHKEDITFQCKGWGKGKPYIVEQVCSTDDYYGIVDMDHDFNSDEISVSERLVDTRQQCCLYSFVSRQRSDDGRIVDDARKVILSLVRIGANERHELILELSSYSDRFQRFVEERTKARLYRGRLGPGAGKAEERSFTWRDITRPNNDPVSDLISNSLRQGYEDFKRDFEDTLSAVGVSDHALSEAIMILLQGKFGNNSPNRRKVNMEVGKLIEESGNSQMVEHFLAQLGLSSTP